ncbi:MAG: hypothetical protein C0625_03885 [Arcobacter sp.]|nr:MAG: hypothetical protein C0625_03885 [Arcobacter sp.]
MKLLLKILIVLSFSVNIVNAEIEKVSYFCEEKMCFSWWPKLSNIDGWEHNREVSLHYSMNTYIPSGYNFSNAESIIYARAIWKEKVSFNSLEEFIRDDIRDFRKNKPDVIISNIKLKSFLSDKYYKSLKFFGNKNYEQVVYSDEKDEKGNEYFILFTLSSFSKKAYEDSVPFFEELLLNYKK